MSRFAEVSDGLLSACVHCGLCLETCATYAATGLEAESPRGRIQLLRDLSTGRWEAAPEMLESLHHCLGCLACEEACPSGVRYGELLAAGRLASAEVGSRSRLESWLIRHVLWRGPLLEKLARLYRWCGGNRVSGVLRGLPPWAQPELFRLIPHVESAPVPRKKDTSGVGPSAVLVRGCVARAVFPATEAAMVRLLEASGYRVEREGGLPCCGALAAHAGQAGLASALGETLIRRLRHTQGPIILTASGCGAHVAHLSKWVAPSWAGAAAAIEKRVQDLAVALENGPEPLEFSCNSPTGKPLVAVYQDACHLRHGLGVTREPRRLLERAGVELREAQEGELCCGSAGSYNIAYPDMGKALGKRKAGRLRQTGAQMVITANPGCAIQLRAHLPTSIPVIPWARFLEQRLGGAKCRSRKQ